MFLFPVLALAVGYLVGQRLVQGAPEETVHAALARQAEEYVRLALTLDRATREGEIDAYFGPAELAEQASGTSFERDALLARARTLLIEVELTQAQEPSLRGARLVAQLKSFTTLLEAMQTRRTFADEARELYGFELRQDDARRQNLIKRRLDALLPGKAPLAQRVAEYRDRFVVPNHKRREVFERALVECRKRTLAHWQLPEDEQLTIEWTRKVGAAWHRYEGQHRSRVQINPDAVAYLGSSIDIACHEGYPGHHAQFVVMESEAGSAGLPIEEKIVLLRSPSSVLREGAANFGVDLAFPLPERTTFMRDVLFPIAGFDPAEASRYAEVHLLVNELSLSTVAVLGDYYDGRIKADVAAEQLETGALISSPQALLGFVDLYGAYAIGYTLARDSVRDAVDMRHREAGVEPWQALRELIATPKFVGSHAPDAAEVGANPLNLPWCSVRPSAVN